MNVSATSNIWESTAGSGNFTPLVAPSSTENVRTPLPGMVPTRNQNTELLPPQLSGSGMTCTPVPVTSSSTTYTLPQDTTGVLMVTGTE